MSKTTRSAACEHFKHAACLSGKLEVRRQEAVAEAMKNATALEKGWEFEERSDRDADR